PPALAYGTTKHDDTSPVRAILRRKSGDCYTGISESYGKVAFGMRFYDSECETRDNVIIQAFNQNKADLG
ncbi:hypothetical protein HYS01_02720, partial [Candidatus Saccharibacteria bacterium]|nr:hypothetical protein [Candidatus Saccharibacteria bacterium]